MSRYFLYLSYLGTAYHGWQVQANAPSVQGVVNGALSKLLRTPTAVLGAGRTDTGVHARQLVAHFDAERADLHRDQQFLHSLNHMLPLDIAVERIVPVAGTANARFDALWREYDYVVSRRKNPFAQPLSWHYTAPLDVPAMQRAADQLLRHNDFTSFSRLGSDTRTNLCTVMRAQWHQTNPNQLVFTIRANRFLRNMVRAIVGTLMEVGRGKLDTESFEAIITAHSRAVAGASAPAQGLYLSHVEYPSSIFLQP